MNPKLVMAFAGVLFGVGLAISGMTQPEKVVGFLDVTGSWNPSLMYVMGGALMVSMLLGRRVLGRRKPLYDEKFHLPEKNAIDRPLVIGAAVFGVGWGMGGFCPGPALVAAGSGSTPALVFVATMVIGMAIHHVTSKVDQTRGGA